MNSAGLCILMTLCFYKFFNCLFNHKKLLWENYLTLINDYSLVKLILVVKLKLNNSLLFKLKKKKIKNSDIRKKKLHFIKSSIWNKLNLEK